MKKSPFLFLALLLFLGSCIPIRIAPNIEDYCVTKGKKFKRGLPKREMFVFEDPKAANEFYNYVNIKYGLDNNNVDDDVPFMLENRLYFFSFYEVEIEDKAIPILGVFADALISRALDSDEYQPIFTPNDGVYRRGNWYIAIEVYSDLENDCLAEDSFSRKRLLQYLTSIKNEYLTTHNYNETVFKN
ncbi:hypothetical protein [Pareuzebyella sediminis]|uniref:hypothetical protein n=1 Tax=Pareuzebyella sediminis TaxID=2607998 RepID=UPI0011EEA92F|nr:hypothetical protein [Pareuzebyella sediminis]